MRYCTTLLLTLTFNATTFAQEDILKNSIGLNIPSLIGKTIDFKYENNFKSHCSFQVALGLMSNNTLKGSLLKISDGTNNWENSGAFTSFGYRYKTSKEINRNTLFIGAKSISGYFHQIAENIENETPIERSGFFTAIGIESGFELRIIDKLNLEMGIQFSPVIYSYKQASRYFSVLPGIGSIGNLQAILTLKYCF
jgi:hypothetical protein